jgi:hypothetical protein
MRNLRRTTATSLGLPHFANQRHCIRFFVPTPTSLAGDFLVKLLIFPDLEALPHEIGDHSIRVSAVPLGCLFELLA